MLTDELYNAALEIIGEKKKHQEEIHKMDPTMLKIKHYNDGSVFYKWGLNGTLLTSDGKIYLVESDVPTNEYPESLVVYKVKYVMWDDIKSAAGEMLDGSSRFLAVRVERIPFEDAKRIIEKYKLPEVFVFS